MTTIAIYITVDLVKICGYIVILSFYLSVYFVSISYFCVLCSFTTLLP